MSPSITIRNIPAATLPAITTIFTAKGNIVEREVLHLVYSTLHLTEPNYHRVTRLCKGTEIQSLAPIVSAAEAGKGGGVEGRTSAMPSRMKPASQWTVTQGPSEAASLYTFIFCTGMDPGSFIFSQGGRTAFTKSRLSRQAMQKSPWEGQSQEGLWNG